MANSVLEFKVATAEDMKDLKFMAFKDGDTNKDNFQVPSSLVGAGGGSGVGAILRWIDDDGVKETTASFEVNTSKLPLLLIIHEGSTVGVDEMEDYSTNTQRSFFLDTAVQGSYGNEWIVPVRYGVNWEQSVLDTKGAASISGKYIYIELPNIYIRRIYEIVR